MQEYCYKCMRSLGGSAVCSHCGYDNAAGQATAAPYHLTKGTVLAGRYLVGNVLGEGGFGITYIGLDTTLVKRVAIKEFYPSGAANRTNTVSEEVIVTQGRESFFSKGVERFLFEAKNVAAFAEEEGVVDVLDYFQENGTAYIVMEFLDGKNLKDYVNSNGCFKLEELVPLMLPIMKSLGYMHNKGIIHRDISPDNIMFTKRGKLKLMDFGSARYYTNEERKMSVILKQGFAPEEQYRQNGEQGPHTDVYALCATIYACVTGQVPVSSLDRLVEDTLKAPSQLGAQVLPYQEQALMHGLALSRKNRTPDMETLIKEFTTPVAVINTNQTVAADTSTHTPPGGWVPPVNTNRSDSNPSFENNEPPKPKKSKTPLIIIIAVLAVVLIGGGVGLAIGLNSGGDKKNDNNSGGSTSSASQSSVLPQSSAESSDTESSFWFSSSPASSQTESSQSSQSTDYHSLVTSTGEVVVTDEAIDTGDVATEQKISNYLVDSGIQDYVKNYNQNGLTADAYACGNVLIYEYDYVNQISDTDVATVKNNVASNKAKLDAARDNDAKNSGIDDLVVVYVYFNADKSLVTASVHK